MICNYANINDYCSSEKYSYYFYNTISNSGAVSVDDSASAAVVRVDNDTGQSKIITVNSVDPIITCDIDDDNEGATDWQCYQIFRDVAQGSVSDPPLIFVQEAQKEIIKDAYSTALQDGIAVTINNQNVLLGASISDQIAYKSVLSYAQALYDDDTDATMPSFTDINGIIYNLTYTELVEVFKTYLTKLIYYKNLQDTLLNEVDTSNSLSDIQQLIFYSTKPLSGNSTTTTYSSVTLDTQESVPSCDQIDGLTQNPIDPETLGCCYCVDGGVSTWAASDTYGYLTDEGQCANLCGESYEVIVAPIDPNSGSQYCPGQP